MYITFSFDIKRVIESRILFDGFIDYLTIYINMVENPKTMHELLYEKDDTSFDNFTLDDIEDPEESDDPVTVVARVHDRGSPLYNEGVYEVLRKYEYKPISEQVEKGTTMKPEELAEEYMPRKPRRRMAYPSLRGQYLRVREHRPDRTTGRTSVIPVEYVISL